MTAHFKTWTEITNLNDTQDGDLVHFEDPDSVTPLDAPEIGIVGTLMGDIVPARQGVDVLVCEVQVNVPKDWFTAAWRECIAWEEGIVGTAIICGAKIPGMWVFDGAHHEFVAVNGTHYDPEQISNFSPSGAHSRML